MSKKENNSWTMDSLFEEMGRSASNKMPEFRNHRPERARVKSERTKQLSSNLAVCSDLIQKLREAMVKTGFYLGVSFSDDADDKRFKTHVAEVLDKAHKTLRLGVEISVLGLEKLADRRAVEILAEDTAQSLRENAEKGAS